MHNNGVEIHNNLNMQNFTNLSLSKMHNSGVELHNNLNMQNFTS